MNSIYSRVSHVRTWIVPAVALAVIIAVLLYLTVSDTGRGLVGLATGTTVTCESLTVGTPITGTVSASPGYDCYDFAADDPAIQGTTISVSLNSKSGSSLDADLYAPGSEVALGNTGYAWVTAFGTETKSGTLALDKGTGSYKIKVWSYSKSLGDYEVSVSMPTSPESQSAPSQASESTTVCNAVSLDTAVSGNIAGSNKFDCYTFTASQSDNVIIKMTSKDGTPLDADLYAPGTPVTEANTGFKYITASGKSSEVTLSTSLDKGDGTYRVKAWSYGNAAEGNYELTVSLNSGTTASTPSVTEICGVLKIGDSISGTISSGDKYDCYKYSAKNGDVITVDITSLSGAQLDADIFEPGSSTYADGAGYYWVSTQGTSKISKPVTLDKGDGEYIIKAWSYGDAGAGGYELNISSDSVAKTSTETSSTSKGSAGAEPATQGAGTTAVSTVVSGSEISPEATTTTEVVVKKSDRPEPLSRAERIVAVVQAPTKIDPVTGCGHRNYTEVGGNGSLQYPDGIYRAYPSGKYVYEWPRNYDYWPELNEKMKAEGKDVTPGKGYENRILYWNDWLGLSPDIEEFLAERNENRQGLINKIDNFKSDLALSDSELEEKYKSWDKSVGEIRLDLQNGYDHWVGEKENTEVIFHGYPLLFPEKSSAKLGTSPQIDDVGYWDFTEAGGNSVAGGYDWDFSSNKKGEDVLFHNGILDVPYLPGDSWGVSGIVSLKPRGIIDKSLHRDKFTLAFSVLPEVLPNEMPERHFHYDANGGYVNDTDWSDYHEKHSPQRLLLSFGGYYRWLQININELCRVEVTLNMSPLGDYREHHSVYLVSQVELDVKRWNEIQFTINIPENQASLTVLDGSEFPNETEVFTLPDDFEWSFTSDWKTANEWSNKPNVHHVDNNLGLFSGSGSGAFGGKLDWIYLANGILDPIGVERRVGPLRESGAVARESAKISVSPDGYSASAELSAFDYPEWVAGASSNSSMRNYLLKDVYSHFRDDFDFVFLVQNEENTTLNYMGRYLGVSNDVMGISEDEQGYDATKYVGSDGKLKAAMHFPLKSGICCGPSLHELMHHWGNYSLATGNLAASTFDSNVILAVDAMDEINAGSHWGVSSVNGQLGGFDLSTLKELGENWYTADPFGTYANGGNSVPYGNFELYVMGLIPPEEVEDVILFKGIAATAGDFFDDDKWYAEKKVTVTAEDVIEKLGARVPDHTKSQKDFRILTLVLTDDPLTEEEWTYFSKQAKDFEDTFSWATGDRATAKLGDLDKSVK
ncbi:MAG TPA: hypothetical protein DCF86_04280 [Dehalococcoidia bacterium]|nr:hypothetical protein [Dehalococcoidia bacterium]